jgi:hypothetical protein
MWVYILFYSIIFVGAYLVSNRKTPTIYFGLVAILLWLIIGFRNIMVGSDTLGYVEEFHTISRLKYNVMWKMAVEFKEPLYIIMSWLISRLSTNYTFYLLIWALFPSISLYLTYKREFQKSQECLVSVLVFFILGLFAFFVAGIRQTTALSIILLSYTSICNKKLLLFFFYVLLASGFHNSAILFIIAYPLSYLKIKWWYLFLLIGVFVLSNFLNLDSIFFFSKYFFGERFDNYSLGYESTQSSSAFVMQLILFAICLIYTKRLIQSDPSNNSLLIFAFVGLLFQSMAGMLAEMSRVSFYFSIFDQILVPRTLAIIGNNNTRQMINTAFIAGCLLYLFFLASANLPIYSLSF